MSRRTTAKSQNAGLRQGFTLIELMLVVFIIGLVYGVIINRVERAGDDAEKLSLETLVDFMRKEHRNNHLAIVCTDNCEECVLYADDAPVKEVPQLIDDSAVVYRFDFDLGYERIDFAPLFDDEGRQEEVCFRYEVFPDGSRSEWMVEYQDRVVDLPGFFDQSVVYPSLEAAIDAKRARYEEIRR